jgi:hypothetical protein
MTLREFGLTSRVRIEPGRRRSLAPKTSHAIARLAARGWREKYLVTRGGPAGQVLAARHLFLSICAGLLKMPTIGTVGAYRAIRLGIAS